MLFSAMSILYSSLMLFGVREYWIIMVLMAVAGGVGGYVYGRLWKYVPLNKDIEMRWRVGIILLIAPFIVSYTLLPFFITPSQFYFSIVWYPSLGFGLLLAGIYAERKDKYLITKTMSYTGFAIVLTSTIFLPLSSFNTTFTEVIASNMLAVSMTLLIYFVTATYLFFKAQRVVYGA